MGTDEIDMLAQTGELLIFDKAGRRVYGITISLGKTRGTKSPEILGDSVDRRTVSLERMTFDLFFDFAALTPLAVSSHIRSFDPHHGSVSLCANIAS